MHQLPKQTERGIPGMKSIWPNVLFGARITQLIVLSSVIAFVACTDTTAPNKVQTPTPETPAAPTPAPMTPLGLLGAAVEDETTLFLTGMHDETNRANLQASLKSLSVNLIANRVEPSTKDVATARGLIAAVDVVQQVELGQVSLVLDVVELALNAAAK